MYPTKESNHEISNSSLQTSVWWFYLLYTYYRSPRVINRTRGDGSVAILTWCNWSFCFLLMWNICETISAFDRQGWLCLWFQCITGLQETTLCSSSRRSLSRQPLVAIPSVGCYPAVAGRIRRLLSHRPVLYTTCDWIKLHKSRMTFQHSSDPKSVSTLQ